MRTRARGVAVPCPVRLRRERRTVHPYDTGMARSRFTAKHHVLIFPQNVQPVPASAAIVLIDEDAAGNMQLDGNGTIIIGR